METGAFDGDLEALAVPLPEDILRAKAHGDLVLANRLIEKRLEKTPPEKMARRLILEQEILRRLPDAYPYDWDGAVAAAQEVFRDFTGEELHKLLEEGAFEWIYLNGAVHIKDDFVLNLVKTREDMADRILKPELDRDKQENFRMLDRIIGEMKAKKQVGCRFHIRSTMRIGKETQRPGSRIQVQLPLPILESQVKSVEVLKAAVTIPGQPEYAAGPLGPEETTCIRLGQEEKVCRVSTAPENAAQRTICFETEYQEDMQFSVEFRFETQMRYWDWEKALSGKECSECWKEPGKAPEAYLSEQLPHIRFTPYLRALTEEVTAGETEPLKKAKRIYDYITSHVMYSFVRPYFTIEQQVSFTAAGLKGDCGLQALLFITMCRIAGIPAGWQSGLYTNPRGIGHHDWARFYLEPYGWLYADCSFGGSAYRAGCKERREFYFGNLDPYRLVAASMYQQDFAFPKRHLRQDPYDNQSGEAEYEEMGLSSGADFETIHEMLSLETEA